MVSFHPLGKSAHEGPVHPLYSVSLRARSRCTTLAGDLPSAHLSPSPVLSDPSSGFSLLHNSSFFKIFIGSYIILKCLVFSPQGRPSPHRKLKTWWKWWTSCRKVTCLLCNWGSAWDLGSGRSGINSKAQNSPPWKINSFVLSYF